MNLSVILFKAKVCAHFLKVIYHISLFKQRFLALVVRVMKSLAAKPEYHVRYVRNSVPTSQKILRLHYKDQPLDVV